MFTKEQQGEKQLLLHNPRRERSKYTCVGKIWHKEAKLVIVWSALLHTLGFYQLAISWFEGKYYEGVNMIEILICLVIGAMIVSYLLYPVAGLVGETCLSRYYVMMIGNGLVIIGQLVMVGPIAHVVYKYLSTQDWMKDLKTQLVYCPIIAGLVIHQIGLALFEANALQFGVDQLLFANSDELSKFAYWYFWSLVAIQCTLVFIATLIQEPLLWVFPQLALSLVCSVFAFANMLWMKKTLRVEPQRRVNPLRHIFSVIQFAWMHKHPVRRSAFTYSEAPPSRLNLAKKRYGGPFTTEEVEDVRVFFYLLILLLTLFGFSVGTGSVETSSRIVYNPQFLNKSTSFKSINIEVFLTGTVNGYGYLISTIMVPLHLMLIRPCINCSPPMLMKIGIGLLTMCLSLGIQTAYNVVYYLHYYEELGIECFQGESSSSKTWPTMGIEVALLLLAEISYGIAYLLTFLTTLEFLLAQAPRNMQGLLVGIWYFLQSVGFGIKLITTLTIRSEHCHYWILVVKTCIALISVLAYYIAARVYQYRQRDEPSDVNRQTIIEEYTERQLNACGSFNNSSNHLTQTVLPHN